MDEEHYWLNLLTSDFIFKQSTSYAKVLVKIYLVNFYFHYVLTKGIRVYINKDEGVQN